MAFPSLKEIFDKAQGAFRRFPITLIWAVLGSFYCIYQIGNDANDFFNQQLNVLLTLVLGVSWLIGIRFYIEQRKNPEKWWWLKLVIVSLLIWFYWHLPDTNRIENDPTFLGRFFLYLLAGHLFVLFAPFINKWDNATYWNYLKTIGFAIVRSALFSGVLYLGLVFALLAIQALFETSIPGERYGQLFIFCLGVVNTWIYLSDFPKENEKDLAVQFNKALEVFVKYILIPLVLLYIAILYAYGFKILLQWELPQGWVSYLVTALALLGFVVQVIINPVQKTIKSWTINFFHPWFYILLLPLIILLFIAIFRRIGDYGITENRYFVWVVALWILGISLYLLFSKGKKLKVLPISLFSLALLSSFGPWGAFAVSKNSQISQFSKVFKTVRSKQNLASFDEYEQLKSILDYLDDRESLSTLDGITGLAMETALKDTSDAGIKSHGYLDVSKILDSLGIKRDPNEVGPNELLFGNHYSYYGTNNGIRNYHIEGFHYMSPITFNSYSSIALQIGTFDVHFNKADLEIYLSAKKENTRILQIPLRERLLDLTKHGSDLSKLDEKELTLESKNEGILVKLIFADLSFNIQKDSVTIDHANAYMFLKQDPHDTEN